MKSKKMIRIIIFIILIYLINGCIVEIIEDESTYKNGDKITILGSNFGKSKAKVLLWDTIENQLAYEEFEDGENVPTRQGGVLNAPYYKTNSYVVPTLESKNTYGNRTRVYKSIGDTHFDQPILAENESQGNKTLYERFYIKAEFEMFGAGKSADKFFRIWDDTEGEQMRISAANSTLMWNSVNDGTTGYAPANEWVLIEVWFDVIGNVLETRYNNIPTGKLEGITLINPKANGAIASLWGYDDGNDTSSYNTFYYSEYYCASTRARVELCNNSNWKKATIREIQQVSTWSDDKVEFIMDAQRIDPNNCWAVILDDEENVLEIKKIGDPEEINQDVRRPKTIEGTISFDKDWISSSEKFEFEAKFLINRNSCDKYKFINSGYNSRINYDLKNKQWLIRSGYGTELTAPASKYWDDNTEHSIKTVFDIDGYTLYIDGLLEASGTGTINPFNLRWIGGTEGSIEGEVQGYIWDVKLTDINNAKNSHHWKFDEQVGGGGVNNNHIWDYAQNEEDSLIFYLENWGFPE